MYSNGSNAQKEAKYALEIWIDEGRLTLEFPAIRDLSTNIKVRSDVVRFTARSFNAFLGMPMMEPDIFHIF
ncbi:hypothetical protein HAX54_018314 [Datura stramonium]|uniref:Uncharacterized protein n=1 Tax=Datura stramonium TaxID=4076 RepID=A0ABS8UP55_DATST|nr:hypothetical protein [Datura stramonium]